MYGLLLENLAEYVKINYGEEKWEDIRRQAGIDSPSFSVHQVYPENLLQKLAKKAQQVFSNIIHKVVRHSCVPFTAHSFYNFPQQIILFSLKVNLHKNHGLDLNTLLQDCGRVNWSRMEIE